MAAVTKQLFYSNLLLASNSVLSKYLMELEIHYGTQIKYTWGPKLMRLVLFQNNNLKNQNKSDILSRLNLVFQMFFFTQSFGKNIKNNSNNFNNNNNNKYNNNDDENDIIFLLSNLLLEGLIILFRFNLFFQS